MTRTELISLLRNDGSDCKCFASSRSECGCDAVWGSDYTEQSADMLEADGKMLDEWNQCVPMSEWEKLREAARLALDALEFYKVAAGNFDCFAAIKKDGIAIAALKEALK